MTEEHLIALLETHLTRYPKMEVWDVYKLLHQSTFGPGHAIRSKEAADEWLKAECAQLTPATTREPLLENIHPGGLIVRLHLRPYLSYHGPLDLLLDAFIRSANQVQGDGKTMTRRWAIFEANAGRFDRAELAQFGQMCAQEQWPAVHHSPAYEQSYRPAYRVLVRDEAEMLCRNIHAPFDDL